MAIGRKELRKLQLGWETSPNFGTPVAATTVWRGVGDMPEDKRVIEIVEEEVGIFGGTDRTHTPEISAALSLASTPATFEQLPILLAAGLGGAVTGVADGVGTGKVYTTTIPTTSSPTNRSLTIEGGDDFEVEQLAYGKPVKIELTYAMNKAVMVAADLLGAQCARVASFTADIALPAVENLQSNKTAFYLDAAGGTYGTTQVANTVIGCKLTFEPDWQPLAVGGQLYPTLFNFVGVTITGEITFLHDTPVSGNAGEKAKWRAETARLLQIKTSGSALGTSGTYSARTAIINLPIKWLKFPALGDENKNSVITATFESKYNTTAANRGSIIVVNEVTAL